MSKTNCPHCDAALTAQEAREGWCEACGKKLPARLAPGRAGAAAAAPKDARPKAKAFATAGFLLGAVILGVLQTGPLRGLGYLPVFLAGFTVLAVCGGIGSLLDSASDPA